MPKSRQQARLLQAISSLREAERAEKQPSLCPYESCIFTYNTTDGHKFQEHVKKQHRSRQCPWCEDISFDDQDERFVLEHIHHQHRNIVLRLLGLSDLRNSLSSLDEPYLPLHGGRVTLPESLNELWTLRAAFLSRTAEYAQFFWGVCRVYIHHHGDQQLLSDFSFPGEEHLQLQPQEVQDIKEFAKSNDPEVLRYYSQAATATLIHKGITDAFSILPKLSSPNHQSMVQLARPQPDVVNSPFVSQPGPDHETRQGVSSPQPGKPLRRTPSPISNLPDRFHDRFRGEGAVVKDLGAFFEFINMLYPHRADEIYNSRAPHLSPLSHAFERPDASRWEINRGPSFRIPPRLPWWPPIDPSIVVPAYEVYCSRCLRRMPSIEEWDHNKTEITPINGRSGMEVTLLDRASEMQVSLRVKAILKENLLCHLKRVDMQSLPN